MEQSAEVAENHQKSDCLPSSKSSGSLVRIDDIYIDLASAMDNHQDASQCDHFSIRGYVAGMREKDISVCFPFPNDNNQIEPEEQKSLLPPLDVVKFKWWNCHNCLREVGDACCAQEAEKVPDSNEPLSKGSCSTKEHLNEAARIISVVACTKSNRDNMLVSSRGYNMEKNDNAGQIIADTSVYHQMLPITKDIISSKPAVITEKLAEGSDAVGRNTSKNLDFFGQSFRGPIFSNVRHLESNRSISTEIVRAGTSNFPNDQQRIEKDDCDMNVAKGKASINRSLDDLSSESSNGSAKNDHHDKFKDSSSKSIRQRAPKVRLMTELLGSGGNAEIDQNRSIDSDFDSASDFCDEITTQTIFKQHSKGKRKITQDENGKPPLFPKKSKLPKENADSAKKNRMVVDSETEESSGAFFQQKNLKNHVSSKKKHKQILNEGGEPTLMPRQKVAKIYNSADTEGGVSRPGHHMYSNTEMDPYYNKSSPSPLQAARKSNMGTKKKKQVGGSRAVPMPQWSSMPGDGLCVRKDFDAHGRRSIDLSLNSYDVACKNKEGDFAKATTVREHCHQEKHDVFHSGESSNIRNSAPNVGSGKRFLYDLNEKIATQSPVRDNYNDIPQYGKGSIQHHRELNMSGICNSEPKNDDQDKGNEDIPMDIVELLAKNQYDRRRYELEKNYFSPEQTNENRKFESMGLPRVHGHGLLKPLPQTTTAKPSEHVTPIKAKPININETSLSMMGGNKSAFARCSSFFDSQGSQSGRASYPDSGSIRNGNYQNFPWRSDHIGSSFGYPLVPNYTNFPQNYAPQASNFGTNFQIPELSSRGGVAKKCLDLNFGNENNNLENQGRNSGFESFQKSSEVNSFPSKHRGFDLNAKVSSSTDIQSNESIPAMQLLSLMDAGMTSNSKINSKSLSRDYHPKLVDKPMFSSDHHPKEPFGLVIGVPSNSSRPSSSSLYGINQWGNNSCAQLPPMQGFGPFASPLTKESNFQGGFGIPTRVSLKLDDKKKGPAQNSTCKLQKPVSNSIHSNQRGVQYMSETVSPLQRISGSELCCVNRNPADFSIPEPGNMYMIKGRDLKFGKKVSSRGRKRTADVNGKKIEKVTVSRNTKTQ